MSKMPHCRNPFPLHGRLDAKLQSVVSLWERLKRGENGIPFSDDLGAPVLSNLPGDPYFLRVFASPERYRFEFLSESVHREAVLERFVDEMPPNTDFSYLRAQSSATIEAGEPTLFHLTDSYGYRFSRVLQISCA
jgi:hypothetical protein